MTQSTSSMFSHLRACQQDNIDIFNVTVEIIITENDLCIYLKDNIKYETIGDLQCCEHHEIIWIKLNLKRIPRGFSCIILAVVYYPGRTSPAESDATNIINHLFDSLMTAESIFPNCGIIIQSFKTSRS